jgi:hypothetical protein
MDIKVMYPCHGMQCTEQLDWLLNYKSILCLFFYCFIGAGLIGFGILYSQAVESPQKLQYGAEHDLTAPGYINFVAGIPLVPPQRLEKVFLPTRCHPRVVSHGD